VDPIASGLGRFMTPIDRPGEGEFAPFYAGYVSLVPETDIMPVLERQAEDIRQQTRAFVPEREGFRYAPGKWSVREVLGHMTDAERVFGFRAFCFGRGDENALPGFDENDYVARSHFDQCRLIDLVEEFGQVRQVNLVALRRLDDDAWRRHGTASGRLVSVRALAYIMAGHVRHHLQILRTRYGEPTGL
jgi:DinB family protein